MGWVILGGFRTGTVSFLLCSQGVGGGRLRWFMAGVAPDLG